MSPFPGMGLFDRGKKAAGDATGKKPMGYGFDPDVCLGCPHRQEDRALKNCGLCGCPTLSGYPMDKFGMPPQDCPYVELHRE